ncbi:MAG: carboxymuconolactone decarboxylase family protein [Spirochaetota bacterium]
MTDINKKALAVATRLMGDETKARAYFERLNKLDPEFSRLTQEFGWAGMYARTVLDDRTRELTAIAALTVMDKGPQLKDHIGMALRLGATRQEVLEVILQMVIFAGFPTALKALPVLEEVLKEIEV